MSEIYLFPSFNLEMRNLGGFAVVIFHSHFRTDVFSHLTNFLESKSSNSPMSLLGFANHP